MFRTLVDVETLSAHGGDPNWVVVDCRHALGDLARGRRLYDEAHIPGAYFVDFERVLTGTKTGTNGRHPLPDPAALEGYLQSIGVNDDTQLVAYDDGADMFAARFWFCMRWIGHDAVAVLDGGIAAWRAAGKPLSGAMPTPTHFGTITARANAELLVDVDFVQSHLGDAATRILDARGPDRFAGQNETIDPVGGHIPGATNRHYALNYDESGRFKSADALREEFAAFGRSSSIVHQCGSGVSATVNLLAMEHAALRGSRLYAGSWSEWVSDPTRPTAK